MRRPLVDIAAVLASLFASTLGSAVALAAPPQESVAEVSREEFASDASCAACDECCGPSGNWFAEAEALLWWRKSRPLPPLVSTNPTLVPQIDAGRLSTASTQILFGNDNYTEGVLPGGRATLGRWLDDSQCFGIAGSFFVLGQDETTYNRAAASASDILAIPFIEINPVTSFENALLLNYPGLTSSGRVDVTAQNDVMGADVYGRYLLWADEVSRVDAIGGYQFSRIDDALQLHANYNGIAANTNIDLTDTFDVHNEFHGGTLGLLAQSYHGRWTILAMGKVGLGNMRQTVNIHGQTVNTPLGGGAVTSFDRGLFTQQSNVGTYTNDEFGVVPEAKINFNYQVNQNWSAGVGYSFIYWNNIVTAGSTLDRTVNLSQINGPIAGPERPDFAFGPKQDFWVQGLNFSLQYAY